jgi:hypothetical protein
MPTSMLCAARSPRHERGTRRSAMDATADAMSRATDKLAHTRRAIIVQLHGAEPVSRSGPPGEERSPADKPASGQRGWWGKLERAAGMWWRQHPASTGLELAKPVLATYAAQRPVQFLGIAAAAGAVIVVTRGWRLISIAGLLAALIKSSPLSSFALAALAAADGEKEDPEPTGE